MIIKEWVLKLYLLFKRKIKWLLFCHKLFFFFIHFSLSFFVLFCFFFNSTFFSLFFFNPYSCIYFIFVKVFFFCLSISFSLLYSLFPTWFSLLFYAQFFIWYLISFFFFPKSRNKSLLSVKILASQNYSCLLYDLFLIILIWIMKGWEEFF